MENELEGSHVPLARHCNTRSPRDVRGSSPYLNRAVRIGLLALATALVVVPPVARAKQHVENRDSTRLSVKHSWVGIVPPAKASVAPVQAHIVSPPVVEIDQSRLVSFVPIGGHVTQRAVHDDPCDPLRGPPRRLS